MLLFHVPPMRSPRSKTVTSVKPARRSWIAVPIPPKPAPMIATVGVGVPFRVTAAA